MCENVWPYGVALLGGVCSINGVGVAFLEVLCHCWGRFEIAYVQATQSIVHSLLLPADVEFLSSPAPAWCHASHHNDYYNKHLKL